MAEESKGPEGEGIPVRMAAVPLMFSLGSKIKLEIWTGARSSDSKFAHPPLRERAEETLSLPFV